jgi:hypothetical protein
LLFGRVRDVHLAQESVHRRPREKATRRQSAWDREVTAPLVRGVFIHLHRLCIDEHALSMQRGEKSYRRELRVDFRVGRTRTITHIRYEQRLSIHQPEITGGSDWWRRDRNVPRRCRRWRAAEQGSHARARARRNDDVTATPKLIEVAGSDELVAPTRRHNDVEAGGRARVRQLSDRAWARRYHGVVAEDHGCARGAALGARL